METLCQSTFVCVSGHSWGGAFFACNDISDEGTVSHCSTVGCVRVTHLRVKFPYSRPLRSPAPNRQRHDGINFNARLTRRQSQSGQDQPCSNPCDLTWKAQATESPSGSSAGASTTLQPRQSHSHTMFLQTVYHCLLANTLYNFRNDQHLYVF